jgi:ADP-ribosylation factor-like protein 8
MLRGLFSKFAEWVRNMFFNRELEISIVGLQNAGKSSIVNSISNGAFSDDTIPTIGFNKREVQKGKVSMKLWDLGGQQRFRESWEKYCRDSDVIIFVVDSSDQTHLDISKAQLNSLLDHESLKGIPLLVLANKNDLEGALAKEAIVDKLRLTTIEGRTVGCFSVSAKTMSNLDSAIKWLAELPRKAESK